MALLRMQVVMSEDYGEKICEAAREQGTDPSQVVRKALDLYFIARQHRERGLKVGFATADQLLEVEVIGL